MIKYKDGNYRNTLRLNRPTEFCGYSLAPTSLPGPDGPSWKRAFLQVVRRRHYSYRTEESYLAWLERFARYLKSDALEERGAQDLAAFLDAMAVDQRWSASSQRQALNALVFFYREVLGKDLGDFSSEYRRAKPRTNLPVWLTRQEVDGLLDCLARGWSLMARVMYGGGLRLIHVLKKPGLGVRSPLDLG